MTLDTVTGDIMVELDNGTVKWSQGYQPQFNSEYTFQGADSIAGIGFLVYGGSAVLYDSVEALDGEKADDAIEKHFDDDFEDKENGAYFIRSAKAGTYHSTAYQLHKALRSSTGRTELNFKLKVDEGATLGYIAFLPQDRMVAGDATASCLPAGRRGEVFPPAAADC
jgi:hypothetical protein